jgi:uncharacterized protein
LNERQYQFEWDDTKAAANVRKHHVSFELAATIFRDPRLLTVADIEHSDIEDRWFSIGLSSDGRALSVVYVWSETDPMTVTIRLISARQATRAELRQYEENQ